MTFREQPERCSNGNQANAAKSTARAPNAKIRIRKPAIEMMKPATASPLGDLNMPIKESRNPRNQTKNPANGVQDRQRERIASTKPAVPIPFVFRTLFTTTVFSSLFLSEVSHSPQ